MPELAWGARGRKFESCRPDQSKTRFLKMIVAKPVAKFKRCDSIRQPTAVRYQGQSSRRIHWRRRSVGRMLSLPNVVGEFNAGNRNGLSAFPPAAGPK